MSSYEGIDDRVLEIQLLDILEGGSWALPDNPVWNQQIHGGHHGVVAE